MQRNDYRDTMRSERTEISPEDLTRERDSFIFWARVGDDGKSLEVGDVEFNSGRLVLKPGAFVPIRLAHLDHPPLKTAIQGEESVS